MTVPKFNADGALLCPFCGGDSLHHAAITVHERKEDESGVLVVVGESRAIVTSLEHDSALFAGRRNDLAITFFCEYCAQSADGLRTSRLQIMQHKGRTIVEWLPPEPLPIDQNDDRWGF